MTEIRANCVDDLEGNIRGTSEDLLTWTARSGNGIRRRPTDSVDQEQASGRR